MMYLIHVLVAFYNMCATN